MNSFSFVVPGQPVPKGRPRVTSRGTFTPARTRAYEALVGAMALCARPADWPMDGEYGVVIRLHLTDYRSVDCDNAAKAILDGMERVAYANDRQVGGLDVARTYGSNPPRAEVLVHYIGTKPVKPKRGASQLDSPP